MSALPGLLLMVVLLPLSGSALAAEPIVQFDKPEDAQLYQSLLREYRCLKCQNQNLADSNASLAGDLRREIREQILAGKNQRDIDEYLVSRYGRICSLPTSFQRPHSHFMGGAFCAAAGCTGQFVVDDSPTRCTDRQG